MILALASGLSYRQIEEKLNTSTPTIARWRARFEQQRMEGLSPKHKGSRPRVATPAVQARIVRRTLQSPPDGSTHWSCRKLARALSIGKSTVQRVWAQAQLKPHRLDRYMASNDPEFEAKAADIIGLYLDPPQQCRSVLRRRKDGHSSLGPAGSSVAAVSGTGRAAWRASISVTARSPSMPPST